MKPVRLTMLQPLVTSGQRLSAHMSIPPLTPQIAPVINVGHLQDTLIDRDSGVVDEVVESEGLLDDLGDCAPTILRRSDVPLVDAALQLFPGELVDERLGRVEVAAIAGRDVGSLFRKCCGTLRHRSRECRRSRTQRARADVGALPWTRLALL